MNLSQFYNYVFGSGRLIEIDERKRFDSDEQKTQYIRAQEERIKNFFLFLDDPDYSLRSQFLDLLSALNTPRSNELRVLLYGSTQSNAGSNQLLAFKQEYDDEAIKKQFREKNQHFKYFSERDNAENDFVVFFKSCKLFGCFLDPKHGAEDSLTSDLAYKMLVVFGAAKGKNIFSSVKGYFNQHKDQAASIHDALLHSIPVNDPPVKDLKGWRDFIKKYGYRGLEYFQETQAIEGKLGRAPQTHCCQYIGGHSEQCVIDGITREKNGFYVLLKGKIGAAPIIDGKINDKNFEIVGQGYAWLSQGGNFVFDSWENLRPEYDAQENLRPVHDDNVAVALLRRFAEVVAKTKKVRERVTIGTGGKTPREFCRQGYVSHPEEISEGLQYGDSKNQCAIYAPLSFYMALLPPELANDKNQTLLAKHLQYGDMLVRALIALGKSCPELASEENLVLLISQAVHADDMVEAWIVMHRINPALLSEENQRFLVSHAQYAKNIGFALSGLYRVNPQLVNDATRVVLAAHAEQTVWPILCDIYYGCPQLVDRANCAFLAEVETQYLGRMGEVLVDLYRVDPQLVNDATRALLAANPEHAGKISVILRAMHDVNPALLNEENQALVLKHVNYSSGIQRLLLLSSLSLKRPLVMNNENFKLLVEHAKYRGNIESALGMLSQVNPELFNGKNFEMLMRYPKEAKKVADALIRLYEECKTSGAVRDNLFSKSTLPSDTAEKLQKYLYGEASVVFSQEDIDQLNRWGMERKSDGIITLDSLPREEVRPSINKEPGPS